MASGRELRRPGSEEIANNGLGISSLNSQLNDFYLLDPLLPSYLPPKAKPLSELNFFNKANEDPKKRKSFHAINKTIKKKIYEIQKAHLYYFKNNIPNSPVSELEAFCCDCYRLLVPDKIPSAHAYYDDKEDYSFVGLNSKGKPFKSNRSDPLLEKDTHIEFIENNSHYQHHLLIENIKLLTKCLDRTATDPQGSYLNSWTQFAKNQINFYKNQLNFYSDITPTAVWLASYLETFLKLDIDSSSTLTPLIKLLEDRKKFLPEKNHDEAHLLDMTLKSAQTLSTLIQQGNIQEFPIEQIKQLEEMDKIAKQKNLGLDNMDRNDVLQEKIFGKDFKISVTDLINYRIVKGLGMGLSARYVFEEGDNHNRNMAKDGTMIDFDMSLWPILSKFKDIYFIDRWLRGRLPNETSFIVTANDIRNFPNIQDALNGFYYWPTKITYLTKSMVDTMSAIYDAAENLFTRHDNEIFIKLAVHPVFIFHKFKTFLKFVLTTDQMYRSLAELNIRKNLAVKDEKTGNMKNLIDDIANHEASRIQQIRKVLISMPEFQDFIIQNGDYVFQAIQDEFIEYQEKYAEKSTRRPFYRDFVDAININEIKNEYEQIYKDVLTEKAARETKDQGLNPGTP
ncbi:MAG: hypothetical protein A3F11_05150 [Gammaproteobacteria bacterium RIFCSPHIGHO2_12_FULL_37_14]|nr:MAG: hypothetical protein A3F11_05150 [Gammaproteobacteria bacterium RIFCSPHIGHO2_12_FULL_37_14]